MLKISKLAALLMLLISLPLQAQSPNPFVPEAFEVPATLETERFRLRMLSINDLPGEEWAKIEELKR